MDGRWASFDLDEMMDLKVATYCLYKITPIATWDQIGHGKNNWPFDIHVWAMFVISRIFSLSPACCLIKSPAEIKFS